MVVVAVGRDPPVVIEVVVAERQCSVLLHLFSKILCETLLAITALSCTSFAATERLNEVREEGKQKGEGEFPWSSVHRLCMPVCMGMTHLKPDLM